MAKYEKQLFEIKQIQGTLDSNLEKLTEKQLQEAQKWLSLGSAYYHDYFEQANEINKDENLWSITLSEDPRVDSNNIKTLISSSEFQEILNFYNWLAQRKEEPKPKEEKKEEEKKEDEEIAGEEDEEAVKKKALEEEEKEKAKTLEPEKGPAPAKEDSTVPAELETLVALYKESQADQIEAEGTHTVADAIKRARHVWEIQHRADLIRENRLAQIQEKGEREKQREMEDLERDLFLVRNINPKAESPTLLYRNIDNLSRQTIIAQATNLGLDLSESQIKLVTRELSVLGITGTLDFNNFDDLSALSQVAFHKLQGIEVDSSISDLDSKVLAWQEARDSYSDEQIEIDKQIKVSETENKQRLDALAENLAFQMKKNNPIKLGDDLDSANQQLGKFQKALLGAIPDAKLPQLPPTPLQLHKKELEILLRQADKSLSINPEGLGARTIAVLQKTNSGNTNVSAEALYLFSIGLNTTNLESARKSNKELDAFLTKYPTVYQQVHSQLRKIQESKLGHDTAKNIKPTGLTGIYNNLSPRAQTATKLILDPVGTTRTWINRRIGEHIGKQLLKNAGSSLSQKLGNFLLNEGLQGGIKSFAKATAEKLALEVAKKIGVSVVGESLVATVALALGISTAGASLLIGALVLLGTEIVKATFGFTKKQLDKLWQSLGWGDEFRMRDLATPALMLGGAAAGAGATLLGGFIFIIRTVQIAVVSAAGIIIGSISIIGLYLGFAYLVAPMLSTLVQFDSVEKVNYTESFPVLEPATPGCPSDWPVKGSWKITQGPGGKYSHYNPAYSQAVDIATPIGTPIQSTTDGIVSFAGMSAPYLNTKIVVVDSKLPNGTAFQVVYAHLSFMKVGQGKSVKVGEVIGSTGTAGTGAHLHYEYKKIKYNQCPAGRLQLAENCSNTTIPGAGKKCVPETGGVFLYTGSGTNN